MRLVPRRQSTANIFPRRYTNSIFRTRYIVLNNSVVGTRHPKSLSLFSALAQDDITFNEVIRAASDINATSGSDYRII